MYDGSRREQDARAGVQPIVVFVSCARGDEEVRERLERHLAALERDGRIRLFHEGRIAIGADVQSEVEANLLLARLVLLLISVDFLHAKCDDGIEIRLSLERQRRGEVKVIPVLVRPCDWASSLFKNTKMLPASGRPISQYTDPDEALREIAIAVREEIDESTGHVDASRVPVAGLTVQGGLANKRGDALAGSRQRVARTPRTSVLAAMGILAAGGVAVMIHSRCSQLATTPPSGNASAAPSDAAVECTGVPCMTEVRLHVPSAEPAPLSPHVAAAGDVLPAPPRTSPTPSRSLTPAASSRAEGQALSSASALAPGVSSVKTGNLAVGDDSRVTVGNRKGGIVDVETGDITIGDDAGASVGNVRQGGMPSKNGVKVRTGDVKGGHGVAVDIGNVD